MNFLHNQVNDSIYWYLKGVQTILLINHQLSKKNLMH